MLDNYIIIGLVIAVVEIFKTFKWFSTSRGKLTVPLLVFGFAGGFNVLNALVFGGVTLLEALSEGLKLGSIAGGLYSMGQVYLNKNKHPEMEVPIELQTHYINGSPSKIE